MPKSLDNTLDVTYTMYPNKSIFFRSINNSNKETKSVNPCVRGISVSNQETACAYASLHGGTKQGTLHKYILTQNIYVVNINWKNIKSIIKLIKQIDILALRNSVSITANDAINVIKKYLSFNDKNKILLLNPLETITINNIKINLAHWFSNIMAYLGFSGYLIDYGYHYADNTSGKFYPPQVYFCFPRLQLKYLTKIVKCKKEYSNLISKK